MLGADTERFRGALGHSESRVGQLPAPRRSRAKDPAARKRAIYVEQACVFCKARKIRCDGQLPGLAELTDIVSQLQRKIAVLERQQQESRSGETVQHRRSFIDQNVHRLEQNSESTTHALSPAFAGPTSAEFGFGIAGIILRQENGASNGRPWFNAELAGSVNADEEGENPCSLHPNAASSPFYGLQLQDSLRLIQLYHESIEILHPILDSKSLQQLATSLFQGVNYPTGCVASQPSSSSPFPSADVDIAHLKMVMAISLLAEGGGFSPVARKIHDDLIPVITDHILARTFTLGGQILLLLTAFYHIFQDDSRLASRYVVIASRIMVEAGLHLKNVRRSHLASEAENAQVLAVLWTCMYLDRQLNFNAGLPLGLNDSDIEIPEMMPPYLKAMTSYMRMGPRAWTAMTDERGQLKRTISNEDFEFLDFQVQRWEESLPKELRILRDRPFLDQNDPGRPSPDRRTQLLRFVLYLRANQFKIVLMRPLLFSTQTFQGNIEQVKRMIQFSNDNIEMIVTADKTCGLYAKQQPLFNLFLSSALSTLLLIYVHSLPGRGMAANGDDPPEMVRTVQLGINNGLELLRSYSVARSSQRLSKKIASLLQCLGFPLLTNDNQTGVARAPSSSSSEGSHPVTISPPAPQESCLPPDFSGWHSLLPDDGLTGGGVLQHQGSGNQGFSIPELDQAAFWNGKNAFDNDILLTFMNEFSG
ncbi:Fungal specific transcription factor domain-containing protein isoform 1 [Cladophialophora immunda]|nr:Fungal specific transcription factor domain-containing protein isoform 1 [Cladophialophora immunda]